MGPPPVPPRSTQTISQMSGMIPALSQPFPQPHATTQEAVTTQAGIAQHSPAQIPITIEQVGANQEGQALTPEQQQQIIQQHLQLHTLQLQEAEQRTNQSLEQISQTLQAHEQQQQQLQQQQQQQQQLSQQLSAGEQLSSGQPQTATEHIQQLAASVQQAHELLPQINLQQLEQMQQQAQQQIQLQQAVQVYQLPQLSPQQLEQLGLPVQLPPAQLQQLVQEHHIQQLQQQQQQQQQNQQVEEIHSSQPQPNPSPEISTVTSNQVIQLTPEQQQQLEQLSEQLNIPVHQLLEEHKQVTERQQRIQQIQRQLSSAEDETTPSPQVIQTEHQISFPQHLQFQDADVHIGQQQSASTQVLSQPVTLDDARDLPQNLEMQLPSQLIAMHSPIALNSLAIQTNLQSALNWAQSQHSLPMSEAQRQEVLATTQAHLVSAPSLTASHIALSPATDASEVTVAQLLNSMASFQDGLTPGLLLQTNPQHQTSLPSDVAVMQAQHASITQPNIHPTFTPFVNVTTTLPNQTVGSSPQILQNVNTMATLEMDKKTMPSFSQVTTVTAAVSTGVKEPNNSFKPIKHQHSELKRRLSADSNLDGNKKALSRIMMVSKCPLGSTEIDGSFAKPKDSEFEVPVRMRSKSGDEYKLMRSKSVDHTFMRPRSRTDDSLLRSKIHIDDVTGRTKSHSEDYLSRSDGAGIFRNPIPVSGSMKFKRKHRPAPLFIPLHLNSFQSRLRSPRLWEGTDGKRFGTPPPYTPPPMLSPIRSGSGLFWTIQGTKPSTPMSAPITPKLLVAQRRSKIFLHIEQFLIKIIVNGHIYFFYLSLNVFFFTLIYNTYKNLIFSLHHDTRILIKLFIIFL